MPQPTTTVYIPAPCAQSWDAMTPTGPGRHCATCQKVVIDFTQKTDAEILSYLAGARGETCGRFRAEQLARPLVPVTRPQRWRAWLGTLLAAGGLLGSGRASAQRSGYYGPGGPAPVATQPTARAAVAPLVSAPAPMSLLPGPTEPLVLRGVVTDAKGNALPGVTLVLKGTTQGTSTDGQGEFVLEVTGDTLNAVLVASFVGFVACEQPVTTTSRAAPLHLRLEESVMGNLLYSRPYPWHPRAFIGWAAHWLMRPFRH